MPIVLATVQVCSEPELIQSFYFLPCIAASLLVQKYASLVQQHTLLPATQAYTGSSSSSSSSKSKSKSRSSRAHSWAAAAGSSSSSSSSNPAVKDPLDMDQALRSWRESASHLGRLPAAHSELAVLLGTDLRTIVWAAITLTHRWPHLPWR